MWPFALRRSRVIDEIDKRLPSRLVGIDFSKNDGVIKLWLSESLLDAIDLLCDAHDASRPDVLRWVMFEHTFGRIEFTHLLRAQGKQVAPVIHSAAVRSLASGPDPLEERASKATEDIKLHLPSALKDALQALADAQAKPLSDYLRGVLHQNLFGARAVRFSLRRSAGVGHVTSTSPRRAA